MMKNKIPEIKDKNCQILIIAPLPPPVHGLSIAVQLLIDSKLSKSYYLKSINTSLLSDQVGDPGLIRLRKLLKYINLILAIVGEVINDHPQMVYLTLAQTRLGILRDTIILWFCLSLNSQAIIHLHGGGFRDVFEKLTKLEKYFIRQVFGKLGGAIVLSESLKKIFHGLISEEHIFVVHNGIPSDTVLAFEKQEENPKPHIVFISNLYFEKGVLDSLQALSILKQEEINFSSTFGGPWITDKDRTIVEKLIIENHLESCVKFSGPIYGDNKINLLKAADIFLFPTFYPREGQPIVLIEALMAGLPIVSTPHASIQDMVKDGYNGFIVPKHSPEQIAKKLKVLIQDKEMRKIMGERSREIFLDEYTVDHYISSIDNVFRSTLDYHY